MTGKLAESECRSCHGLDGKGVALRAYRDDRRESTTMHKMSLPYGDSISESIAAYFAGQPPK